MNNRLPAPARLLWRLLLIATLVAGSGCSQVSLVYRNADVLLQQYIDGYLDLDDAQRIRWEPHLRAALARHRTEELPALAAFFDQMQLASRTGFDAHNAACFIAHVRDLYRRHARLAVTLVAPLLAELTAAQIDRLERQFRTEMREDLADLATRDLAWEQRKRAKRYNNAIEDWTGPLHAEQSEIVAEVTGRLPDAEAALIDYRTRKREEFLGLLRQPANATEIQRFMTAWLVDLSDLPPELERAGETLGERLGELLIRLGASLDAHQHARLEQRLRQWRDDLLNLQEQPRLAPLNCLASPG